MHLGLGVQRAQQRWEQALRRRQGDAAGRQGGCGERCLAATGKYRACMGTALGAEAAAAAVKFWVEAEWQMRSLLDCG